MEMHCLTKTDNGHTHIIQKNSLGCVNNISLLILQAFTIIQYNKILLNM